MDAEKITQEEAELIENLAEKIVRWGLASPAAFFLEAGRPLTFLAGQAIFFVQPLLSLFFPSANIEGFAHLIEKRSSIDEILKAIEVRAKGKVKD